MNIKINKTLEGVLLLVLTTSIASLVTYVETSRLAAHFMQIGSVELVSYVPIQKVAPAKQMSVSRITAPSNAQPWITAKSTAYHVEVPVKPPVATPLRKVSVVKKPDVKPAAPETSFPPLGKAIYPVGKTPNWGAMKTPQEWERIYAEMNATDFVDIPPYSVAELTTPMSTLTSDRTPEHIALITAKLFYSTRFFGRYNVDSGEFEGVHAGLDLKLAAGTPVWSIAGGIVHATGVSDDVGNYVMILHKLPDTGEEVVSIYGHLERIATKEGETVQPGTIVGYAGSTGKSLSPHLHLQIDKKKGSGRHVLYAPGTTVSSGEAANWTLHPIEFIAKW